MGKSKLLQSSELRPGEIFLKDKPNPRRVVMDDRLIRREYYNPNKFAVYFQRMEREMPYIVDSGINPGLPTYRLEPDGFLVVPHAFFIITAADRGVQLFDLTTNFGNTIGIGNKLPSPPEFFVKKHF